MWLWLWLLAGHGPERYHWPGPRWERVWVPGPPWGRARWGATGEELSVAEMDELNRDIEKGMINAARTDDSGQMQGNP